IRVMNLTNALFAEAATFEADCVQSIRMSTAFRGGLRKRQNVANDSRPPAYVRMRADADELMHWTERANDDPVFHDDMTAQRCGVGENRVVSDQAIMCDVSVGHDQVVAADLGQPSTLDGPAIQGHEFADNVVIANLKPRGLAFVGEILRRKSD